MTLKRTLNLSIPLDLQHALSDGLLRLMPLRVKKYGIGYIHYMTLYV